ncbi:MAG: magnesium/cobalt transporter CorA [Candidatus Melainabacteria bacterium]|nr:magnesium/cobalt transporter CorA [Candidatus Melainabacteria bacterium]
MPALIKKRSRKAGLPPGTLIHIGEKKTEKTKITLFDYDELHIDEKEVKNIEECLSFKDKPTVTWINVEGIHEVEVLEKLGNYFGIHPLALEDIVNTDQRPKIDDFENNIFIVLKMLSYNEKSREIITEQISLILGSNFVISFQEGIEGDVFNPIRDRIRANKGRIRKAGSDYLTYRLLDAVVDNYFVILEKLGEKIELLQEELIKNLTPEILHKIHDLKREMIFLRKTVWPLREVISGLQKIESSLVEDTTKIYLRDIYDHTIQVMDSIETFREMISSMIEIYLSNLNNRINSVMKVLTIIATIFMPPTFIVGIYGMNFKYMPELDWKWAYPVVLLIMLIIAVSMLIVFKKKKWW